MSPDKSGRLIQHCCLGAFITADASLIVYLIGNIISGPNITSGTNKICPLNHTTKIRHKATVSTRSSFTAIDSLCMRFFF